MSDPVPEEHQADLIARQRSVIIAGALGAAVRHGLLEALSEVPRTTADLAAEAAVNARGAQLVLDGLDAAGLVESGASGYALPTGLIRPQVEAYMAGVEQLLLSGKPQVMVDEATTAQAVYPAMVGKLAPLAVSAAARIAERVKPGERVLDVAAGAAPYGMAAAQAGATVTLLDLADVVQIGEQRLVEAGFAPTIVTGDVFDADLDPTGEGRFDAVVVGGFCRLFGPERVQSLLCRVASWLVPGGRLFLVDAVDSYRARCGGIALYALDLATRTGEGGVHSLGDYLRWLERAGFEEPEIIETGAVELTVISAEHKLEGAS